MRYTKVIFLGIIAACILIAGCGKRMLTTRIEDGIAARLPQIVGPARSYKVEVSGHTKDMIKGDMTQIRIFGEGVNLLPELVVDELQVTLNDVDFDTKTQTIKSCGATKFIAVLREPTFNAYLKSAKPDLPELGVKLLQDKVAVHIRPTVLKMSVGVDLEGYLRVVRPAKIYFEVDRLKLAGLKMPGMVADYLEEKINPIQDFSSTGLSVNLTSVNIAPGLLKMQGSADLMDAIKAR